MQEMSHRVTQEVPVSDPQTRRAPQLPDTVFPSPRLDVDDLVHRTEAMLAAGIPLTLLMDLLEPGGPDSAALYAAEL